jgi:hypothetical protein
MISRFKRLNHKIKLLIGTALFLAAVGVLGQVLPIGAYVPMQGGSPSVGSEYEVNVSNGSGGWLDASCNIIPSTGPIVNCPAVTFNTTRQVVNGSQLCPLFPDNHWINTNVSGYPQDQFWTSTYPGVTNTYSSMYASTGPAFTAASWSSAGGGVATITVGSTSGLTSGVMYFVGGAISSNCLSGQQCGFNSYVSSLGNYAPSTNPIATITIVDGTHFTYPLTVAPGTWVSGGTIYTTNWRFKQDPSMSLNLATNSTATLNNSNAEWQISGVESDAGPYPWLSTFLVEGYNNTVSGGYVPTTVSTFTPGGDAHVFSINFDTCTLYETFGLQNTSSPWQIPNGAIWNLRSNDLRTAHKLLWYGNDASGVTSADVAGLPMWPLILQYAEVFGSGPITHAMRIVLNDCSGFYNGFVWPASHGNSGCATTPPLGSRWILSSGFDTTTCHYLDCAGLAWPTYMQKVLTALQNYGVIFADAGSPISITTDADSRWGATNGTPSTSTTVQFEGYLHGIKWTDGYIIDPTQHVVNVLSGATH